MFLGRRRVEEYGWQVRLRLETFLALLPAITLNQFSPLVLFSHKDVEASAPLFTIHWSCGFVDCTVLHFEYCVGLAVQPKVKLAYVVSFSLSFFQDALAGLCTAKDLLSFTISAETLLHCLLPEAVSNFFMWCIVQELCLPVVCVCSCCLFEM